MKIAIITSYWNPPQFKGGISRVVYELKRIWEDWGHEIDIFALETQHNPNGGIYQIPVPSMPLRVVAVCMYLTAKNRLDRYDIIFPQSSLSALFLDKNRCIPFVHTMVASEHRGEWWRIWRDLYPYLESYALKGLRRVIALSDDSVDKLVVSYNVPLDVICKVSNGVDTVRFCPTDQSRNESFTILAAGRFIPRKRFDLLLRAVAMVLAIKPDASLVLAGDGDLESDLRNLACKLGIEKRVSFSGLLDEERILALYRRAHVFVHPSAIEGMPMVVLEAQACGLPAIIGPFSTAQEVVENGKSGWVVKDDSPDAWANILLQLANNEPMRIAMGQRARVNMLERFCMEKTADRIISCFTETLYASSR